jgi:hypothetical protein
VPTPKCFLLAFAITVSPEPAKAPAACGLTGPGRCACCDRGSLDAIRRCSREIRFV